MFDDAVIETEEACAESTRVAFNESQRDLLIYLTTYVRSEVEFKEAVIKNANTSEQRFGHAANILAHLSKRQKVFAELREMWRASDSEQTAPVVRLLQLRYGGEDKRESLLSELNKVIELLSKPLECLPAGYVAATPESRRIPFRPSQRYYGNGPNKLDAYTYCG